MRKVGVVDMTDIIVLTNLSDIAILSNYLYLEAHVSSEKSENILPSQAEHNSYRHRTNLAQKCPRA